VQNLISQSPSLLGHLPNPVEIAVSVLACTPALAATSFILIAPKWGLPPLAIGDLVALALHTEGIVIGVKSLPPHPNPTSLLDSIRDWNPALPS
jgi:hypothetical protein